MNVKSMFSRRHKSIGTLRTERVVRDIKRMRTAIRLEQPIEYNLPTTTLDIGWLVRWKSLWIGCHYSDEHRRFCVNIVPCVTVWIVLPGGKRPTRCDK